MKKVYNDTIPFKGKKAMTVWPFLFIRNDFHNWTEDDERHEGIHGEQQKEMLQIGIGLAIILFLTGCGWWSLLALPIYFIWYIVEWLVRIMLMGFTGKWWKTHQAYRDISSEQEAYANEKNANYLSVRKHFAWMGYIFKTTNIK